ncbi:MAG: class I SAM-dependent methyltransferase [Saprospiraceae bacterium]|nr:class I SAM-dependent methyltransferase [Saprospiraceae bacterium]
MKNHSTEFREIAEKYRNETDKGKYESFYQREFSRMKNDEIIILEIGVFRGKGMEVLKEFFPNAKVYGIDIDKYCERYGNVFIGSEIDKDFLLSVVDKIGEPDIIIDDGSHKTSHQKQTFDILFPRLKSGGIYVIEDLETSYLSGWLDDDRPTTDFLKEKIDEVNLYGKSHKGQFARSEVGNITDIQSIRFYTSICFIEKYE